MLRDFGSKLANWLKCGNGTMVLVDKRVDYVKQF